MDPQKKIRELEKWAESFAKKPTGGGAALKIAAGVGVAAALYNSFFGVEGGHKAIVFNCVTGLGVCASHLPRTSLPPLTTFAAHTLRGDGCSTLLLTCTTLNSS